MAVKVRLAAALCAAGLTVPLAVAPAEAAPTAQASAPASATAVKSYSMVKEFYSRPLKKCIRTSLWGQVTFGSKPGGRGQHYYTKIRLKNPTMRVSILKKCGRKATSTATKIKATQRWYETRCKAEVGVQAGVPWSIGVSVVPECGSARTADRASTYSGKRMVVTQYNSGSPVRFGDVLRISQGQRFLRQADRHRLLREQVRPLDDLHEDVCEVLSRGRRSP